MVYLQNYDDPEAETIITTTLIIFVNSLWVLGFETSQKQFYRENSTMTKFRMIPEPYIT